MLYSSIPCLFNGHLRIMYPHTNETNNNNKKYKLERNGYHQHHCCVFLYRWQNKMEMKKKNMARSLKEVLQWVPFFRRDKGHRIK